jgi:hypothetical protein
VAQSTDCQSADGIVATLAAVRPVALKFLMEMIMAFVTADVVPTPGEETPFKVVFKQGEIVLIEWEVNTQQEGEAQIIESVKSIADAEDDD